MVESNLKEMLAGTLDEGTVNTVVELIGDKWDQLVREREMLISECDKLATVMMTSEDKIAASEKEVDKSKKESSIARNLFDVVRKENTDFMDMMSRMSKDKESLSTTLRDIQEKLQILKEENESLVRKTESLVRKTESLEGKNESLVRKTESLEGKNESLEGKNESLDGKNQNLVQRTESLEAKQELLFLRMGKFEMLMSPVFVTNVANQLWILVTKAFGSTRFDNQVLDTFSLCFANPAGIGERLHQLRVLRNKYTHVVWTLRHISQLQSNPDLMAACEYQCPAAVEIVQHADHLVLLVIASEVIQRCKFVMCANQPWELVKDLCISKLANAYPHDEDKKLPNEDKLKRMFDAFKTWEDQGSPVQPASRMDIVLCINEWRFSDPVHDRPEHTRLEHVYDILQHAIPLLTATEEIGEIHVGKMQTVRIRLTKRRKMAHSKLMDMWHKLRKEA